MKQLPLTRGLVALVDDDVYKWASHSSWYAATGRGGKVYAARRAGRAGPKVLLHRLILDAPDHLLVDHCNGNSLDCRRENLRLATSSQNACNRPAAGGYKGVRWSTSQQAWEAYISVNGHRKRLGRFPTAERAARAYNLAAAELHGEFAWLNEIPEVTTVTTAIPRRKRVSLVWNNGNFEVR